MVKAERANSDIALHILAVDGLTALQHRGTEAAGLVGSSGNDRQHLDIIKGHGLVRDVFVEENLCKLKGSNLVIGHNRYSTAGRKQSAINCVQPFVVYTAVGAIAIAHNGELVDAKKKGKRYGKEELFGEQKRLLMLHEFRLGSSGAETFCLIDVAWGKRTIGRTADFDRFNKFNDEHGDLTYKQRAGHPHESSSST
ncbi:hypothetical protein KIN20_037994 [Parelaphostrongylus tenuis]|uniref:Glutamine amidotransferase type-2 domain-containing protein n=1 Tax=Parelaphostrongylus tenuis TaxID=148309 RepID=A0AAD5WLI1_PARTN|nr:hypothetical protein KIN20_037994 [Parelaphostrongylus tenuis]